MWPINHVLFVKPAPPAVLSVHPGGQPEVRHGLRVLHHPQGTPAQVCSDVVGAAVVLVVVVDHCFCSCGSHVTSHHHLPHPLNPSCRHKVLANDFLQKNYDNFFYMFNKKLICDNFVTKRWKIVLLNFCQIQAVSVPAWGDASWQIRRLHRPWQVFHLFTLIPLQIQIGPQEPEDSDEPSERQI